MKILIQNCRDWRFYRADLSLTGNANDAKVFGSHAEALAFSRKLRSRDFQVVMRMSNDESRLNSQFQDFPKPLTMTGDMRRQFKRSFEEPLSRREQEIMTCLAGGRSNKEIADHLAVSYETVRSHLKNIYGKLQVRSRTEAVLKHFNLEMADDRG
jgi:ATP/maltotriose-dependent transcriptional regulator MalT